MEKWVFYPPTIHLSWCAGGLSVHSGPNLLCNCLSQFFAGDFIIFLIPCWVFEILVLLWFGCGFYFLWVTGEEAASKNLLCHGNCRHVCGGCWKRRVRYSSVKFVKLKIQKNLKKKKIYILLQFQTFGLPVKCCWKRSKYKSGKRKENTRRFFTDYCCYSSHKRRFRIQNLCWVE